MRLYVYDILESILAIEEYTKDISEESFYESRQVQDAVIRRFEIIGEAVKNLDTDFRNKYSDVPWIKIAAIRNVFIHEYFGVRLERVWAIINNDLPNLKLKVSKIWEEIKDAG
jgi:uncharacterized protein with HEPN domain